MCDVFSEFGFAMQLAVSELGNALLQPYYLGVDEKLILLLQRDSQFPPRAFLQLPPSTM